MIGARFAGTYSLRRACYEDVSVRDQRDIAGLVTVRCRLRTALHSSQSRLQHLRASLLVTDPTPLTPWGLSRSSSSPWWISDNGTGLSTLFNGAGVKNSLIVTIPKVDPNNKTFPAGTPTEQSSTASQRTLSSRAVLPPAFSSLLLTAQSPGGTLTSASRPAPLLHPSMPSSWSRRLMDPATPASPAPSSGNRYLYAANFTKGRVDVYDNNFHRVTLNPNDQDQKQRQPQSKRQRQRQRR